MRLAVFIVCDILHALLDIFLEAHSVFEKGWAFVSFHLAQKHLLPFRFLKIQCWRSQPIYIYAWSNNT